MSSYCTLHGFLVNKETFTISNILHDKFSPTANLVPDKSKSDLYYSSFINTFLNLQGCIVLQHAIITLDFLNAVPDQCK